MKTIYTLIILLLATNAFSQSTIIGIIKDEKGETLAGANIYFQGTYEGTSSSADGSFEIKTKLSGIQIINIEYLGFESVSKEIDLNNKKIQLDFTLKEKFNKLKAVTITAGTFEAGDKRKSVVLSPIDMVTTAGASGDVYGALKMLPGVNANPESGRLFVKGGHSDESQTYINGTLVHVPYNSSVPNMSTRGRFNPFIFGGTVFSTGGYSAEYGQALSSVLLLETKDLSAQEEFSFSLLTVGADAAATKLWKGGGATATFGFYNLKPYMKIVPQNFDWQEYPVDLSGEVSIQQKTNNGQLKLYVNYGDSKLSVDQANPSNESEPITYQLKDKNIFINALWKEIINKNLFIKSGLSYSDNLNDININSNIISKKLQGLHLKSVLNYQLSPKVFLKTGAEYGFQSYDFSYQSNEEHFESSIKDNHMAAFTEAELYTSNKFVSRVGGRVEYSNYINDFRFSPRISSAYKFNENSILSLSWGWFFQKPSNDYLMYTNNLDSERSDHYTLSFQHTENNRVLKLDLYYKDYKNLVRYDSETFYLPESYNNKGHAYAGGLDFFWRDKKSIQNAEYWISYSYLDTKRLYRDYPIESTPYYASKHNLSLVFKYFIGSIRSLAGFTYRYASPRSYNDPNSNTFNDKQTIAYQTIDLNWTFLYRENIVFYTSLTNVPGFKQEFGYRFAETPNSEGVYSNTPIIPGAKRFFLIGCFITLSAKGDINQLDKIN